jgi:uncharacterized Zn finger protein
MIGMERRMGWGSWDYRPYQSVGERQRQAAREIARLRKSGRTISPIRIEGREIATTFWGKAWCDNLESYSDYANRLPRGRTYVRNGSVMDLQIAPGVVTALVCGHELYRVDIKIRPVKPAAWRRIKAECAGKIDSLIELLKGKLSGRVMEIITRRESGLFPAPAEIALSCSCPDWAEMCKHVAASLYGVGARLDEKPELLFVLRRADHTELIGQAENAGVMRKAASRRTGRILKEGLSEIFGIELDTGPVARPRRSRKP